MEVIIKGDAKEIAALILAVQERQDIGVEAAEKFHQHIKDRLEESRANQASH